MTIPRIDWFNFLFNGGRGVRTDQLAGAFIESLTEDETTGIVTLVARLADGTEFTHRLDGSLLINAAPDADPQPLANAANFISRRLWWDGVVLKRVARTPGHGVQVNWPEYANANYRGSSHFVPDNFIVGQHYYNLDAHNFVYRILQNGVARNVGGTPAGFRGPVRDQAAAERLVSGNGQLFEWNETVYRSANYVAPANEVFFWESVFGEPNELDQGEVENATSDVQGTVSGRRMAQAVAAHSPFTDVEQGILEDLSRLTFPHPTDDWQIRQTYVAHDFFADRYSTFLSLGWDADNRLRALSSDGHVARLGGHDRGRIYDGAETLRAGLISGVHWLFLRDEAGGSVIERAPVDGGDDDTEFQIVLRYFSMFADPDSGTLLGILRRVSATDMEVGFLAYDAAAGTITAEDTITLTRAHIDAALGADYAALTDIHRESATGVYQEVAGAILEGDTLYLLLTDIAKTDGHTASVLVGFTLAGTPNNRTLTVLAENAVDELPVSDELTSGILPLEADELFLARDTAVYRLSPQGEGSLAGKADKDLGNVDDDLTIAERQAVREKLAAASQGDLVLAGNAIEANAAAAAAAAATASAAGELATAAANSPARSDDNPENVGAAADPGTNAAVARKDHAHALPTDATLEFDSVSGDLGVSIHDIIEHTQERITYHTDLDVYPHGGGATVGQIYTTSAFRKTIIKVEVDIDPASGGLTEYEVRLDRVHENRVIAEKIAVSQSIMVMGAPGRRSFNFTHANGEVGIPIDPGIRLAVLCSRIGDGHDAGAYLRNGPEAAGSPNESYDDASADFNLAGGVVYRVENPEVGQSSHSHQDEDSIGGWVWGNIRITYRLTYDHGTLIGEGKADTDLQNIDEDLTDAEKEAVRTRIGAASGGPGGAGGFDRSVLFEDTSDRAVVVSNGTPVVLALDRPPVAGSSMRIEFRENSGSTATPVNATYLLDPIPSDLWLDLDPISSTPANPNNMMAFILKRPNAAFTTTGLVTYMWVGRTADGELVMRCGAMIEFNLAFRVTVREILPSGGVSSEQQSAEGGRILRTRSVVAGDTLIAANNFNFDLSEDGQIALGRYALNPTPRNDIFDFVATIRVGGRGGIPIRLSREQFDYVGEYDLQDTWPFGGTGGGSWGNVTEIPCAMLYVNHRSEGIVKTQLKPQRQQIGWSMSDPEPATTVLFFFSYNSAGNIDFVEMIVFTDQVVEIEGVHFHYWEDA